MSLDYQIQLARMNRLCRALVHSLDTRSILEQAFHALIDSIEGERGILYLLDGDEFSAALTAGVTKEEADALLSPGGAPLAAWQMGIQKGPLGTDDCQAMFVPLRGDTKTFGVLAIQTSESLEDEVLDLWEELGTQIGRAAENAELFAVVQASRDRFRQLIDTANAVIVALDKDGKYTSFNDTAEALTGFKRDEVVGRPFEELAMKDQREEARQLWGKIWTAENTIDFEFPISTQNGEERLISWSTAEDLDLRHQKVGVVLVGQDISRQRELEQSLHQAEKLAALGTMVSGVAHELNNPLTAVIGFSELLTCDESLSENVRAELKTIHEQGQRCREVVDGLLHFARKDMGARLGVKVNELIQECIHLRKYHFHLENIELQTDLAEELPDIIGDPAQLKTAFLNIMNNAHDAMVEHSGEGKMIVRTRAADETKIEITIEDTGPGVPYPERIFEPFFTTKEVGKGTGLGLSATYGIVSEHGGVIRAENLEVGALFTIELPVASLAALNIEELQAIPAITPERTGQKILVIDDETAIASLLCRVLGAQGFETRLENSVDAALPNLKTEEFDAIISDIRMPGEYDGESLFRWLQEHRPELAQRVGFISGELVSDKVRSFVADCGCPVLAKPFSIDEFMKMLGEIMA
jgi:PAS domain S-box-containing protein